MSKDKTLMNILTIKKLLGWIRNFHPLETCAARCTKNSSANNEEDI